MCAQGLGRGIGLLARLMSEVQMSRIVEKGGDYGQLERMSAKSQGGCWCSASHPCLWEWAVQLSFHVTGEVGGKIRIVMCLPL